MEYLPMIPGDDYHFVFSRAKGMLGGWFQRHNDFEMSMLEYAFWPRDFGPYVYDTHGEEHDSISGGVFKVDLNRPPLYSHSIFDQAGIRFFLEWFYSACTSLKGAVFFDEDQKKMWIYDNSAMMPGTSFRFAALILMLKIRPGWQINFLNSFQSLLNQIGYHIPEHWVPNLFLPNSSLEDLKNKISQENLGHDYFFSYMNATPEGQREIIASLKTPRYSYLERDADVIVTLDNGACIRDYVFDSLPEPEFLLGIGPDILDALCSDLEYEAWQESHFSPGAGLYIDLKQKRMCYWVNPNIPFMFIPLMERLWEGWQIAWHAKGWPYQYALSGRNVLDVVMDIKKIQKSMLIFSPLLRPYSSMHWNTPQAQRDLEYEQLQTLIAALPSDYDAFWKEIANA